MLNLSAELGTKAEKFLMTSSTNPVLESNRLQTYYRISSKVMSNTSVKVITLREFDFVWITRYNG